MSAGLLDALRAAAGAAQVLGDGDLAAWELDWRKRWRGKPWFAALRKNCPKVAEKRTSLVRFSFIERIADRQRLAF